MLTALADRLGSGIVDPMRVWLLLLFGGLALPAGCFSPNLTTCADGSVCPVGLACDPIHNLCVSQEQLDGCAGQEDGMSCVYQGRSGSCAQGVCLAAVCGDGIVVGTEVCDDGNTIGGDGCSATCLSDEQCGNGIVDPGEGCDCGSFGDPVPTGCVLNNSNDDPRATCHLNCTLLCGDGFVDEFESCDSAPPVGDCLALGYQRGRAECTEACGISSASCARYGFNPANSPGLPGSGIASLLLFAGGDQAAVGLDHRAVLQAGTWHVTDDAESISWQGVSGPSSTMLAAAGNLVPGGIGLSEGRAATFDGVSWTDLPPLEQITDVLDDVELVAADDIVFVGRRLVGIGIILEWDGDSWSNPVADDAAPLYSIARVGASDLVAVGSAGVLHRRIGGSWSREVVEADMNLLAVTVVDGTVIVGGQSGAFAIERDDGWDRIDLPDKEHIKQLVARSVDDVFAITNNLTRPVLHFDGIGWAPLAAGPTLYAGSTNGNRILWGGDDFAVFEMYEVGWKYTSVPKLSTLNPGDRDLGGASGDIVVTDQRHVYKWTGAAIEPIAGCDFGPNGDAEVLALAADDVLVWFAGTIRHCVGGGAVQIADVNFLGNCDQRIRDVWADSAAHVYFASRKALLDKPEGGALNEFCPALEESEAFVAMSGSPGGPVYAITNAGRIWSNQSGSWAVEFDTQIALTSMWVATDGIAFVGGVQGAMWTNASGDWLPMRIETTQRILAIQGTGSQDVVATTAQSLHHYNGVRWSLFDHAGMAFARVFNAGNALYFLEDGRGDLFWLPRPTPW